MERNRWILVLSPLFVLGVTLVIVALGKKKLWKRPKSKDEESADILFDEEVLPENKPLSNQHNKEGKIFKENVTSEPKIPLLSQICQESLKSSSTGTEDIPHSAASSRNTSHRRSSDSVLSSNKKAPSMSIKPKRASYEDQPPEKPTRTYIDKLKVTSPSHTSIAMTTSWPSEGQSSSEGYEGQPLDRKSRTDSRRPSHKSDTTRPPWPSEGQSLSEGYKGQPLDKKSRTDVDKQDFIRPSHKSNTTIPPWPSEGQSSREGYKDQPPEKPTRTYIDMAKFTIPSHTSTAMTTPRPSEGQSSSEVYEGQPPDKKGRTDSRRPSRKSDTTTPPWPSESQSSRAGYEDQPPEKPTRTYIDNPKVTSPSYTSTAMTPMPSEGQSSSEGYEGQPPDKKSRTDSRRPSHKSDTTTPPWPSEDQSSREDYEGQPPEKPTRSYKDKPKVTSPSHTSTDMTTPRPSEGQSSSECYEGQPPDKKSKTDVDKHDSRRPSHRPDTTTCPWPSEDQSSSEGYEGQPLYRKSRTDVDKQDFIRPSHKSDTTTPPWPPESQSSSEGYEGQLLDRKSRTDVDKQDFLRSSHKSDAATPPWPPEGQSSREGETNSTLHPDPRIKMFLEKLMALDVTARNISSADEDTDTFFDFNTEEPDDIMDSDACNPLDVVCDALRGSDSLFQQAIVSRMSMCQFALPLLIPASDGSRCTFMLWAMRDIVKKWRPQSSIVSTGFEEDDLVNIPMPIFSFFRLGRCSLSKSKLLNQVLSSPEFILNYFVHGDLPGGNVQRKRSDGLVEMACYFPAGRGHSDIFPNPVTVLNLRGELECHEKEFDFLSKVSLAVFVFIESISKEQYPLLSRAAGKNPRFFFIVNSTSVKSMEGIVEFQKSFSTTHNLTKERFIVKTRSINDTQVVKILQSKLKVLMAETTERSTLKQMAATAAQFNFEIDENFKECQEAKKAAKEITSEIKSVLDYKREEMKLQGDLWKQLATCEKELCRMRNLENRDVEEYKSHLQGKMTKLREQQSKQGLANGVRRFQDALKGFSSKQRMVFLKWLKISLDKRGRSHLAMLNNEYRDLLTNGTSNAHDLMEIDRKIADGSLGVEHFIRELGQYYEVEYSLRRDKHFSTLPKEAADLLLDGFPLELIDGDASNIPMQWITDVLSELDEKTGKNCTVRVITVLGVQSTGKSTLLNTMFGLQFPTSSGRCTRGAFMILLDTKNYFQEDMGCDYVMVIDTEGLKSMELASLEGSYEHDNELATVVVGLSDITIINMAMENTEEMKDILQIVIHAFLRMKEVGKKSSCQFVHQNVSDVSAHVKNRKAREKFLDQLNEMTKVSARMEKKGGITSFSDIIHCDIESNSWYIPGLWHGIPPMASINYGYSENVQELKKSIAGYLKTIPGKPQNFVQFTEWMRSLWNAVKHEKFVFSFRNRLVTEAYNQLCIQYSDWEWRFQKTSHNWMINTETLIYNLSSDQLGSKTLDGIRHQMNSLLDEEEHTMARNLEKYFMDDCDNAHLLEMFKFDFFQSIKYLRKNLELLLLGQCERAIQIQKEKCQVQAVQERYISIIEERVSDIMDKIRKNQYLLNAEELRREFEAIWEKATSTLPQIQKRDIGLEILQQLKRDMQCDDHRVIQKLDDLQSLCQHRVDGFHINAKHLREDNGREWAFADRLASYVQEKCNERVIEIANSKKDFNAIYSLELLKMINDDLNRCDLENLRTTKLFELDLKLYVLGDAAVTFQRMHEDFAQSNNPRSYLKEMKPQYFAIFTNMYEKRNECQRRAKQFCMVCLRPAVMDHINRHLGKEIVDDILQKNGPQEFKSRKILQQEVLKQLLTIGSDEKYVEYVNNYDGFMKRWILKYLRDHYEGQNTIHSLQVDILHTLTVRIRQALYDKRTHQAKTISDFLVEFCNVLKKELVISQNSTKVVSFQSDLSTMKQFARDVELYLPDLEKLVEGDITSMSTEQIFSQLTLKPQDELFRKVMGCGKQCPFCKAPCEALGEDHKEHFASVHRPRGLARHVTEETNALDHSICSSNILSNKSFRSSDTEGKPHPYKDYRKYYPDWAIYPDTTADGSDYWRFVLQKFNVSFAKLYNAHPANIPEDWYKLTETQALNSLKKI